MYATVHCADPPQCTPVHPARPEYYVQIYGKNRDYNFLMLITAISDLTDLLKKNWGISKF